MLIEHALQNNTYWDGITVDGKTFMIRRVENIDKLIETISDEEFKEDERFPYWAEIWPSSIALSEYVLENKDEFSGRKILELGCGLGLVGIVLTSIGSDVVFTDHDSYALQFTQENFYRNFKRPASVELLDWRDPGGRQSFDIIVAADIIYEKRWLEPVLNVLDKKLATDGKAYIADPDRTVGRHVFELMNEKNWYRQSLLKPITVYNKLHHIVINKISKC
jgi:predicted nicotinamide N-methyase